MFLCLYPCKSQVKGVVLTPLATFSNAEFLLKSPHLLSPASCCSRHDFFSFFKTFLQVNLLLCAKVYTFAPMNVKLVTYSIQTLQRNSKFFASFYAIYLVNPNNCVTHTHTHILTSAPTRA